MTMIMSSLLGHCVQPKQRAKFVIKRAAAGLLRSRYVSAPFSSSSSLETTKIKARDFEFHVEICNPNAPHPVVLLPGALGTARSDFECQLDGSLGPDFRVIGIDPRGLGGSSTTGDERPYHADNFYREDALDVSAIMKELGHSQYSVLGWSDGANAAIHLAANETDAVQNLVVWGGNASVTANDVQSWENLRDLNNWSERVRKDKAGLHGGLESLQRHVNLSTDAWIRMYTDRGGDMCLGELHRIRAPTFVLHGALDIICEEHHAHYIAKQIANSSIHIFPDGKHNIHQRHADTFNPLVRDFLLRNLSDDAISSLTTEEYPQPAIDEIAYAFMGSKALFAALEVGVFDAIHAITASDSSKAASFQQIETECHGSVSGERLKTLLSACVALRLIHVGKQRNGEDVYWLPKASAQQLVKSSNRFWGDYITKQVSAQFYNRMSELDDVLTTGNTASHGYETWFKSDPEAARQYTQAQHNGSLATGHALHKRLPDVWGRYPQLKLLDVGGGSGAFSIASARKLSDATAVVLDLPNVVKVADEFISMESESVRQRVSTVALSATAPGDWYRKGMLEAETFDVVLMSYVSGSIPHSALPGLYHNAFQALKPGGCAIIHDFFVDNDGQGPKSAALWALAHVTVNPEGMGLRPNRIVDMLSKEGFVAPRVDDLIPGATQLVTAIKPRG